MDAYCLLFTVLGEEFVHLMDQRGDQQMEVISARFSDHLWELSQETLTTIRDVTLQKAFINPGQKWQKGECSEGKK